MSEPDVADVFENDEALFAAYLEAFAVAEVQHDPKGSSASPVTFFWGTCS